jgi:spore germination protein YaaH/peptidoglycan/xylan/chitin deacetylase (PgdA/CDA1 family)/GT2 family glycosyltransferase
MAEAPVFYDPSGRRRRVSIAIATVIASVVSLLVVALVLVMFLASPKLPDLRVTHHATTYQDTVVVRAKGSTILTPKARRMLMADVKRRQRAMPKASLAKIVVGYYATFQSSALASFKNHAGSLTHIVPGWLHLTASGDAIDFETDYAPKENPKNHVVEEIAKQNGVRIVPMLDNYGTSKFDRKRSERLLRDEALQARIAKQLAEFLVAHGYDGIHLDLEELNAQDDKGLLNFAKVLRTTFAPYHLSVSAAVEADNDDLDVAALAEQCNWIVPMLYDEHSQDGEPGPIASLDWVESRLAKILETVPESKVVMGVGTFGYDWTVGVKDAESLTFQDALTTADGYRSEAPEKVLNFDAESSNTTYAYRDDDEKLHRVWYLDAVSAYNQCRVAADMGIRGAAVWSLGQEDPALWSFFDRKRLFDPIRPERLDKIAFPYEVSFQGQGEIIDVASESSSGERRVTMGEDGYVESCKTLRYASPFVVTKRGYVPKKIALTFDDGPDRQWTPLILDELKKLKVPGTFFDIGANVEQMPDLVAREYNEGHEVGNHSFTHPDLGAVAKWRARAEIDLTQMAIQAATGHSTALFRPPYNADSQPETPDQLQPVLQAAQLGYTTVAENVDPTDWDLSVPLDDGGSRPKTSKDIADFVVNDLRRRAGKADEGNIVLLHDAGGDRSQTVKALESLVPRLQAMGYQFVTVSSLIHKTRADVMPPISAANRLYYTLGRVLGTGFGGMSILASIFTLAIYLGIGRTALIVPLALAEARREKTKPLSDLPPVGVSVVIAAYNEAVVVERTIRSVLASDYLILEVILVDDGSTDGTGELAREAFKDDSRVIVTSKPNGGKASALNFGIEMAHGELLFHIDADTVLDPQAIGRLANHFVDENIAAVAGNVQVGNRINLLTWWQDLEYITSQNLDRRAYSLLNCITVVPGAIGMWRRSAVLEAGGYQTDTLAEDMDLTWRLRRKGYRLENEPKALAYTEAPERFKPFLKQRFRWAYGTLQCLVKHRGALGRNGWFGRLALPTQWAFGVVFQALAPLIDLEVLKSVFDFVSTVAGPATENQAGAVASQLTDLKKVLFLYGLFLVVELIGGGVALRLEGKPLRRLLPLLMQRFAYRQMMYAVMFRSLVRALAGGATGWGKLARTGTVKAPSTKATGP